MHSIAFVDDLEEPFSDQNLSHLSDHVWRGPREDQPEVMLGDTPVGQVAAAVGQTAQPEADSRMAGPEKFWVVRRVLVDLYPSHRPSSRHLRLKISFR